MQASQKRFRTAKARKPCDIPQGSSYLLFLRLRSCLPMLPPRTKGSLMERQRIPSRQYSRVSPVYHYGAHRRRNKGGAGGQLPTHFFRWGGATISFGPPPLFNRGPHLERPLGHLPEWTKLVVLETRSWAQGDLAIHRLKEAS